LQGGNAALGVLLAIAAAETDPAHNLVIDRTAMLFSPSDPVRQARTWEAHAAILRAIIDGNERAAAALAVEHVMRAGSGFLARSYMTVECVASAGRR
jgi:DNA-binding GntR family transcriptional regulator